MKIRFFRNITKFCCIIKLSWLILASIIIIVSIESCSAPVSFRDKLKTSPNNKTSNQQNKNTSSSVINSNTSENSINSKDYSNIDEVTGKSPKNKTTVTGVANHRMPTLEEQMAHLNQSQSETNNRIGVIENELTSIKLDMYELKDAGQSYDKSKNKKDLATENTRKRHQIIRAKDVILSDEDAGVDNESDMTSDPAISENNKDKSMKEESEKGNSKSLIKSNNSKTSKDASTQDKSQKPKKKGTVKRDKEEKNKKTKIIPDNSSQTQKSSLSDNLAMKYFTKQEYDKAITELNKDAQNEKDPSKINNINYYTGESYFGLKQWDKAINYFDQVIKSSNNNKKAEAQIMIGEAEIRSGQTLEAKKAFQALIDQYPKSNYIPRARKMLQML